jgi:hypothetical protein
MIKKTPDKLCFCARLSKASAFKTVKKHIRAQPPLNAAVGLSAASPPPPCARRPGFPLQSLARGKRQPLPLPDGNTP